jgi:hypothetical protein
MRVQLSAGELETWLSARMPELKDAAASHPLVSSLFAKIKNKVAFVCLFLDEHEIGFDIEDYGIQACIMTTALEL